jgi:hypothetical protein
MALQGTLSLDIAQYQRAVAEAKASMQAFGLDSSKVAAEVGKLSHALDGSKIVAQAHAAAAAIRGMGGATVLTDKEARKHLATIDEARAKYKALGMDAPAALNKMSAELQQATKQSSLLGGALGQVKTVAAGFVAGFTVDRLVRGMAEAVTSTIAFGDEIADLSDKTGVSTTALQRWSFAAKQTGTELQTLVNASQELNRRLGEGETSTIAAIERLGLNFQALKTLSPEQQLETVASALKGVTDQTEQSALAADVFGKSWKEVIAPMRAGLAELGDEAQRLGAVLDETTIRSMGQLADSWQKLKDTGTGLIGSVLAPMVPLLNEMAAAAGRLSSAFSGTSGFWEKLVLVNRMLSGGLPGFGGAGGAMVGAFGTGAVKATGTGAQVVTSEKYFFPGDDTVAGVLMRDLVPATRTASDELREMARSAAAWSAWNGQLRNRTHWAVTEIPITYGWAEWARQQGRGLTAVGDLSLGALNRGSVYTSAMGYGGFQPTTVPSGHLNWGAAGLMGLNAAMPWVSQLIAGGSRSGQLGGSIGGSAGGVLGSIFTGASGVMGAIAPFLGPVAGIVGGLIGKLFGPSRGAILGKEADARIGQTQASLLQQYGSLEQIAGMGGAGAALAAAWGSKNVAGEAWFNELVRAFEKQNALLEQQKGIQAEIASIEQQRAALVASLIPTWDQVSAVLERYGLTLDGVGTQIQQLAMTSTWTQMAEDIDVLVRAGVDVGGMLAGMADEISALVRQSIQFGTTIPQNLKPFVEELARAGLLLDENGQAITDLAALRWGARVETEADRVTAAMTKLDEAMERLIASLDTIIDQLANVLPRAAAQGAAGANAAINSIDTRERGYGGEIPEMAAGGIVTRPTLAWIGERGPEAVVPLSRASRSPVVVQVVLDGRVLAESVMREMPGLAPAYGV